MIRSESSFFESHEIVLIYDQRKNLFELKMIQRNFDNFKQSIRLDCKDFLWMNQTFIDSRNFYVVLHYETNFDK